MQKHIKNYLEYYWMDNAENIRCEICWMQAVDVHHVTPRSKFWKKNKEEQDNIKNLIALCREDHMRAHFQKEPYYSKEFLYDVHSKNL